MLETMLRAARPESWEAMMGTIGEILSREARQEGLQVGRVEGKAEGLARSLVRLLEHRFSPLPQDLTAQITRAELETDVSGSMPSPSRHRELHHAASIADRSPGPSRWTPSRTTTITRRRSAMVLFSRPHTLALAVLGGALAGPLRANP